MNISGRTKMKSKRLGITLVELLISIMILGIGLISLATLFPIGMLRLQQAQRQTRSAYLLESAGADLATRGLLSSSSFTNPYISPWYVTTTSYYDPWIQDTPTHGGDWAGGGTAANVGAYSGVGGYGKEPWTQPTQLGNPSIPGPGLPVAYDPLWRYRAIHPTTGVQSIAPNDSVVEARFGAGVGPLNLRGADGLQRITNLNTSFANRLVTVLQTFVSPEDVVWQDVNNNGYIDLSDPTLSSSLPNVVNPSPILPDITQQVQTNGSVTNAGNALTIQDWRYTWMFTGQRTDTFAGSCYDGSVVVFENRPFAVDAVSINGISDYQVAGEPVVLAAFGYSGLNNTSLAAGVMGDGTTVYYGTSNNTVLLFWPSGVLDPEIKPGGWIADVTYERQQAQEIARFQFNATLGSGGPPAQRCHWYRVNRVTTPADLQNSPYSALTSTVGAGGRYMFVTTSSPVKSKTLLSLSGTQTIPYHINAALVSPYVVNVVPRTFVVPN